jgi:ketosteroid isomerase-like protein
MAESLIAFIESMDRCWLERRHGDLASYLADDVVFVAPGGKQRVEGLAQAVESYRAFMESSQVQRYQPANHTLVRRGDSAVVEYDWHMTWESGGEAFDAKGREVLVLAHQENGWRVIWRMQLPA